MSGNDLLIEICTENVYKDNIFHILGLNPDVTAHKIRRRKEDFEIASNMGEDAWKSCFKHLLGTHDIPSQREIDDCFSKLEDPEYRIISDFFWFWPLDDNDNSVQHVLDGNYEASYKLWREAKAEASNSSKSIIAVHNLAVLFHLFAISYEHDSLKRNQSLDVNSRNNMLKYWDQCILYWENLADNEDFWDVYESRMRQLDDPRLTGGFIRRFRETFPIVFDNINAHLAIQYAKINKFFEAQRHIEYIKKTMSELDDVDETMRIVLESMERRVRTLISASDSKAKSNPKDSANVVRDLLNNTEEICKIVNTLLPQGDKKRDQIFIDIVDACSKYLIAYGNSTEDWRTCLTLSERLEKLACTESQKDQLKKNIETLKKNIEIDEEEHSCCVCHEHTNRKYTIQLYGNIKRGLSFGQVTYSRINVDLPCCDRCGIVPWHLAQSHSNVKELVAKGWKQGEEPTQNDIAKEWGINTKLRPDIHTYPNINIDTNTFNESNEGISPGCIVWAIIGIIILNIIPYALIASFLGAKIGVKISKKLSSNAISNMMILVLILGIIKIGLEILK